MSDLTNSENQADLLIVAADDFLPALDPLVAARERQGLKVMAIPVSEIYNEFGHGATTPFAIQAFVSTALENWEETKPKYPESQEINKIGLKGQQS